MTAGEVADDRGLPGARPRDAAAVRDTAAVPDGAAVPDAAAVPDTAAAPDGGAVPGAGATEAGAADAVAGPDAGSGPEGSDGPEGRVVEGGSGPDAGGGAAGDGEAGNPLQRLIRGQLRERGLSYGQVARRGGLPRSTVYTLAVTRNLVRPPRPATIDALARGLGVPASVVRAAAAESAGLHYYEGAPARPGVAGDGERELLIASIDELSAEDRRHVAALVESLRSRTPPGPAGG
jgi:transcriptional regulator with XRE-family HTH domain